MVDSWRGRTGAMDAARRDLYLAGAAVARVAAIDDDGFPHVVPLWYEWDGQSFWFVLRERAEIAALMSRNPHVGIVIDETAVDDEDRGRVFTTPKVWAKGIVEVIEEPNVGGRWVAIAQRMAVRYLGPNGPEYIAASLVQPRWLFAVTPGVMRTWEGAAWARRYWVDTADGPSYDDAHGTDGR